MMLCDFRSDTVTLPSVEMKQAMISAPLGDDVLGDEPTVQRLEATIAELLGKEDALFVPSGTMANQIAIWIQTRKGDAIAVDEKSHIFHYESGAPALISSTTLKPIVGNSGIMNLDALKSAIPPDDPHFAPVGLVCAEDTANKGGGTVYPLETLDELCDIAHAAGASAHLDGARIFNAQTASQIDVARRAQNFDTVSICFSKGLGAPVGSALCLPKDLKKYAIRARKALGGGMRQSGILAAAALYAIEHNIHRLQEDHDNAKLLAKGLKLLGYKTPKPPTNMVYFETPEAQKLSEILKGQNILALPVGPTTIRMVTHLDISRKHVLKTLEVFEKIKTL